MRIRQIRDALIKTPVGLLGLLSLCAQVVLSVWVVVSYPDDFGNRVWSNPIHWVDNPKAAPPAWIRRVDSQPRADHWQAVRGEPETVEEKGRNLIASWNIPYSVEEGAVPAFLALTVRDVRFEARAPLLALTLIRPDETRVRVLRHAVRGPREGEEGPYERHFDDPLRIQLSADESTLSSLQEFLAEEYGLQRDAEEIRPRVMDILFGVPDAAGDGFTPMSGEYVFLFQTATRAEGDGIGSVELVAGGDAFGRMGTDSIGRDLAQGLLYGLPTALVIGVVVALLSTSIGTVLGMTSGYLGGTADTVIQRLSDIVANIPVLPLLIFLLFIIGPNLTVIIGILIAFSWPGLAIQVRVMVLHMRSSQLIEAVQSLGSSRWRVMYRHILPQIMPYFLAQIIFTAPSAILAEAGLSFLGLGDPSIPTWGQILEAGFRTGGVYVGYWWWIVPPGLLIVLVASTFMLLSLAIEPVVNPRLRQTRRAD